MAGKSSRIPTPTPSIETSDELTGTSFFWLAAFRRPPWVIGAREPYGEQWSECWRKRNGRNLIAWKQRKSPLNNSWAFPTYTSRRTHGISRRVHFYKGLPNGPSRSGCRLGYCPNPFVSWPIICLEGKAAICPQGYRSHAHASHLNRLSPWAYCGLREAEVSYGLRYCRALHRDKRHRLRRCLPRRLHPPEEEHPCCVHQTHRFPDKYILCPWINTICRLFRQDSFPRIRVSQRPARRGCQGRAPARILPRSHPRRRMIGPYGDAGCSPSSDSQTRKPQLGASRSATSDSPY